MSVARSSDALEALSSPGDLVCSGAEGAQGSEADLGWALAIVTRAFRQHADVAIDGPGGPRGYLVLAAVAQGQPRSQLALAQQLGVDKTVMTYLLDELEEAGLVTRRPDPADRRARQVAVTEKGSASLAESGRRLADAENRLLSVLDAGERQALRGLLGRVAQASQSVGNGCMEAHRSPC